MKPSGIIPVLATPFDESGRLDLPSLRRLVEFSLDAGCEGLALFGLASEGYTLTAAERRAIIAEVRAVSGPDVGLVAGISTTSTECAIEQSLETVSAGADALMVMPPHLVKPSPSQLVDFYGATAEAAGVHVMVQDAPAITGVAMPPALLAEMSLLPGVDSVKIEAPPTAPKVSSIHEATGGSWPILGGQNALFVLEEHERGAIGTMPACEFSDVLSSVLTLWHAGQVDDAHHAFNHLLPLIRFGMQPGIAHAVHKTVLVRRGIFTTATVRQPAHPIDAMTTRALDRILDHAALPVLGRTPAAV